MEILQMDTVDRYNKLFGLETLHPLVSVVRIDREEQLRPYRMNVAFYALFLKESLCGRLRYGRTFYDYAEGTVVCYGPGQVIGLDQVEGVRPVRARGLLFHPELIRRTPLGGRIKDYTFFSYETNEALHLSKEERGIFNDCLDKIDRELRRAPDRHTRRLLTAHIELVLDYCTRFYERQFTMREELNHDVLARFDRLLDAYLLGGAAARDGIPTVRYFADQVCLAQLLRRPGQTRNGQNGAGIDPAADDRGREGVAGRPCADAGGHRRRPRIPLSPALRALLQAVDGCNAPRLPPAKLTGPIGIVVASFRVKERTP